MGKNNTYTAYNSAAMILFQDTNLMSLQSGNVGSCDLKQRIDKEEPVCKGLSAYATEAKERLWGGVKPQAAHETPGWRKRRPGKASRVWKCQIRGRYQSLQRASHSQSVGWRSPLSLSRSCLEPELSVILCVKSTCQTQQRCHGGQSSASKVHSDTHGITSSLTDAICCATVAASQKLIM